MDAHSPYIPDEDHNLWADEEILLKQGDSSFTISDILTEDTFWSIAPSLRDLYDGAIRQADSVVKNLIYKVKESNQFDDTLIVVTSDHGEGFGEESEVSPGTKIGGHNYGIHEVLTHVPLMVKRPNQNHGKEIHKLATLTNFPELVISCINNESEEDKLTEDTVYSMTYRLLDSAPTQFPTVSNINQYIGPWKAVYTQTSNGINKYAIRGDDGVSIHIDQSNTHTELEQNPHETVSELYKKIESDEKIGYTTEEISNELKENLENLGYI
jgi:arylsulfatase A-like enzyme